MDHSGVIVYEKKEGCHAVPGFENLFFEVTLLKEYMGRENVLKIVFNDGDEEYETLNHPYMFLSHGTWLKSHKPLTPHAFTKLLIEMRLKN